MIRIAQIGLSDYNHGMQIWNSINENSDIFEVVGYALPENERELAPKRVGIYDGFREMTVEEILNDKTIQAVTIETEEKHLLKYAIMAAKAGKHIHLEKPGSQSLEEFTELVEILKNSNTVFHVGYMYRYNPYICELKNQIKNGELGEIISVEAQMNCIHPKNVREWLSAFPGGMMFFLGCHLIDLIYSIQGEPKTLFLLTSVAVLMG